MHSSESVSATEHILALRDYPRKPAYFLAVLEDIFANLGFIPEASKTIIQHYFMLPEWPDHLVEKLFHDTSNPASRTIMICEGPCCKQAGADQLAEELHAVPGIHVKRRHCMGSCKKGPAAMVGNRLISDASANKIKQLL